MSCRGYFYILMTFIFFSIFVYFAYESWDKYNEARISTNVRSRIPIIVNNHNFCFKTFRDQKQINFQYPSITVCPEKTFKTSKEIPESGTFENVRKFYLDNVRSLDEVFFFVNQMTRSRDGHKCMTGKVSEDPGRPCLFPLTYGNQTYTKCVMPST